MQLAAASDRVGNCFWQRTHSSFGSGENFDSSLRPHNISLLGNLIHEFNEHMLQRSAIAFQNVKLGRNCSFANCIM
jgi:hypothetical protein